VKRIFSILFVLVLAVSLMLVLAAPALAWQEGPGTNWWYIDASYGGWKYSVPLEIELNGNPSDGQTFNVGDTITITGDVHAYAGSCAGWANEASTEWHLEVNGPSGPGSDSGSDYAYSNYCAESEVLTTLSIAYTLTATGTHTVYMSSYAAVSQYWTDVAEDYVDASINFEVVPAVIEVDIDIKPGSDPNSINLGSNGVVPVAILGSATFDASTVDPSTVVLAGATVRFKGQSGTAGSLDDVNGDGYLDFVVQVYTIDFAPGDGTAELTGATYGGDLIHGTDSIRVVPPE